MPVRLQRLVGGLELPAPLQRPPELGLGPDDREQPQQQLLGAGVRVQQDPTITSLEEP